MGSKYVPNTRVWELLLQGYTYAGGDTYAGGGTMASRHVRGRWEALQSELAAELQAVSIMADLGRLEASIRMSRL